MSLYAPDAKKVCVQTDNHYQTKPSYKDHKETSKRFNLLKESTEE